MSKIKVEDIQNELEKYGWKLISQEYKNLDSELIFECEEGHKVYSTFILLIYFNPVEPNPPPLFPSISLILLTS